MSDIETKVADICEDLINRVLRNEVGLIYKEFITEICKGDNALSDLVEKNLRKQGFYTAKDGDRDLLLAPKQEIELVQICKEGMKAQELLKNSHLLNNTVVNELLKKQREYDKAFAILSEKYKKLFNKVIYVDFKAQYWQYEDCLSACHEALIEGIREVDYENKENTLSTFLKYKLMAKVQDEIERKSARIPTSHTSNIECAKYKKYRAECIKNNVEFDKKYFAINILGRKNYDEQKINEKIIRFETGKGVVSLNSKVNENDSFNEANEIIDTLSTGKNELEETYEKDEKMSQIYRLLMDNLTPEQFAIYILSKMQDKNIKEITSILNNSQINLKIRPKGKLYNTSNVSQIKKEAEQIVSEKIRGKIGEILC